MKKTLIIIAFVSMVVVSMVSCKTTSHCPAYGSVNTEQVNAKV